MFLQRTMEMLAQCPKDIALWNKEGTMFTVKHVQALERRILPQYFKHSNFASFTRQLRFYGFEKTKRQEEGIVWWEFTHPKFLRDAPIKMESIKRKTCTDPTPKWNLDEVTELRSNLSTLQDKMKTLMSHVSVLTIAVQGMASTVNDDQAPVSAIKKSRKPRVKEKLLDWDFDILNKLDSIDSDWLQVSDLIDGPLISFDNAATELFTF